MLIRRLNNIIRGNLAARLQRWAAALAPRPDEGYDPSARAQEKGERGNEDAVNSVTEEQEPLPSDSGPPKEWLDRVRAAAPHLLRSTHRRSVVRAPVEREHFGDTAGSLRSNYQGPPLENPAIPARTPPQETPKSEASRARLWSSKPSGSRVPEPRRSFTLKNVRAGPPPANAMPAREPYGKAPGRAKAGLPITPVTKPADSVGSRYGPESRDVTTAGNRHIPPTRWATETVQSESHAETGRAEPLLAERTVPPARPLVAWTTLQPKSQSEPDGSLQYSIPAGSRSAPAAADHRSAGRQAEAGQPGPNFQTFAAPTGEASLGVQHEARPPAFAAQIAPGDSDQRPASFSKPSQDVWPELLEGNESESSEEWRNKLRQLQRLERLEREQRGEAWNE